jgi:flagellar basal body-associated protein FliL
MKKILILVVVILLLAVAALGALGYFGKGPLAPLLFKSDAKDTPPAEPPAPRHRVIFLGEFVTPIVRNHAVETQIAMDIDLEINIGTSGKLNGLMPIIDHRVRMELYDVLRDHADTHSAADRQAVHDRVLAIVQNTVGPGVVQNVSIRTFYSR